MEKNIYKIIILRARKILLKIILFVLLFTLSQVIILKYINPFTTPNVVWEWAESVITNQPEKRPLYIFKPIDHISPYLRKAVIAAEDQRFPSHNGFDLNEIRHAVKTLLKQKKLRGASTISMQTARSVFWLSSRKPSRKIVEVYYTILIELIWDKQRILEMYLNTVDWGTSITGAEAAAQKYFSKSARDLTPEQAALMTAVLPSPHKWSVRHPSTYVKKRQLLIMEAMKKMPLL